MHQIFIILQEKHKHQKLNPDSCTRIYDKPRRNIVCNAYKTQGVEGGKILKLIKHLKEIKKVTLHHLNKNVLFCRNTLSGGPMRISERFSCAFRNALDFKLTWPKPKLTHSYLSNALSAFSLRSLKVPTPTPTHVALFCKLSVHQVLGIS